MSFRLSREKLNPEKLKEQVVDIACGGFVSFEGWVRNHNAGKAVSYLIYQAYETLALSQSEKILAQAKEKFQLTHLEVVHRIGTLQLGEVAVWIGVASKHRKASFQSCEYIIDNLKKYVPIWKNEFYTDGTSSWVQCQHNH